jgi:hypothetical protein
VSGEQLQQSTDDWATSIVANSWHTLREEKKQMRLLSDFSRDKGLKWAREDGPGVAPDMLQRIQDGFQR